MPVDLTTAPKTAPTGTDRLPAIVWATGWVSFLTDLSTELIYAILPAFYKASLGLSQVWLGIIEGAAEGIAALTKLFSGHWSDRTGGRKWWMVAGYSLSTLAKPILPFAAGGWSVLGLRGVDRVGKGVRGAPRDAIISREVSQAQRGHAFGIQRAMDHGGALAGGLLAFLLLRFHVVGYKGLFWITLVPGAAAVLLILLFVREHPADQAAEVKKKTVVGPGTLWRALGRESPTMRKYLLVLTVFALGNSTDALLLARAQTQFQAAGMQALPAAALLPLLWSWLHVVKSASSTLGGRLSDRLGRARPVIWGWLIYAVVYAGFAFWTGAIAPWVLFGVYGLYYGLTEGPEKALVADLENDPERRGTAYGLYHFVTGISALPASALCGWLWWQYGAAPAFLSGGILSLLAALLLPWALRRRRPAEKLPA